MSHLFTLLSFFIHLYTTTILYNFFDTPYRTLLYMPPSVDIVVKLIVCLWFFVAIVAGLALFLDKFLISFIPKF